MVFCEIALRGLPRFDFAYCVTSENHNVEFRRRKDYLEISLQEEGISCREFTDGTKMLVLPKMLSSVFSDSDFCSTAANGEAQYHTTVGVKLAYSHIRHDTATEEIDILALQERLKNGHTFLIPETLALDADFTTILTLLKTIVACVNSPYSYDQIQAVSKWYKLCFLLTKIVLKELEANMPSLSPGAHQYVIKAKDHIYANYSRELTVAEIAGALRISPGYLHSIFKAEMAWALLLLPTITA